MLSEAIFFKTMIFLFFRLLLKQFRNNSKTLQRSLSANSNSNPYYKFQRYPSLAQRSDLTSNTLLFSVEGALLTSPSLFPYFMLVAFEAGSIIRASVLFLLYPIICLVGHEMGVKIMVMVCFFGIKKQSFRAGSAVLPKLLMEDLGMQVFEVLKRGRKRVGVVSDMPLVMVESFLRDYLEVEVVIGREVKVWRGYFMGVMEQDTKEMLINLEEILEKEEETTSSSSSSVIGITGFNRHHHHQQFHSLCKEIYLVSEGDKRRNWLRQQLPISDHQEGFSKPKPIPKPVIFHDGRLAFKPTPMATLAMFMWLPFGFSLAILRIFIGLTLPYSLSIPIIAFSGARLRVTTTKPDSTTTTSKKGLLYVCNHRTLLDPLYIAFALKRPFTAVTYSLSRMSEILAPIKTVRLTRDRDRDAKMMEKLLNQGDMIVCPEGTTCREPYLLRFSPLFAELSDHIVPVALNAHVSMFYGTTASGLKCLDPFYFFANPCPSYALSFLHMVPGSTTTTTTSDCSSFNVANSIQKDIGDALGFQCTKLTRKDKYLILAGNEGIVSSTATN